jgi:hypothetical protein
MAKASIKPEAPIAKKSAAKPKTKKTTTVNIEKVSEEIVAKLKALNVERQLVADLEWCLGSYRYDQNPSGLLAAIGKALDVLKAAQAKKTKGITATLIGNIEKVLK